MPGKKKKHDKITLAYIKNKKTDNLYHDCRFYPTSHIAHILGQVFTCVQLFCTLYVVLVFYNHFSVYILLKPH